MKATMKRTGYFLLLILFLVGFSACTSNEEELVEEELPIVEVVIPEEPTGPPEGMTESALTGLYIDQALANRRPVAVMINNIRVALPQSGISQAEIIYETLAEGNITRLLAIFQDFDAEQIGPVRSARHYYLDLAYNHDAVFIHYGGSPQAYTAMSQSKIDHLDGIYLPENLVFWRDPVRRSQKGMYEHSVYTSAEKIMTGWERGEFREEISENLPAMLTFHEEEVTPIEMVANTLELPFTSQITTRFEYDPETQLYNRFQFGEAHIDANTEEQFTTKNIIVQYTQINHIQGDAEGRRDVKLIDSGQGMYLTNGKAMPITWSKASQKEPTQYVNGQGEELKLNKGNTWIIIFPDSREIVLN